MRINRFMLALTVGTSILALGATAHAAVPHASSVPAVRDAAGPASGKHVVELGSQTQALPAVGDARPDDAMTPDVTYHTTAFTNNDGGECLDGDTNTIGNNGAKVQLWGCNGWSNQNWYWTPAPGQPTGYYTIQNGDQWQCLDGDTNTIGNNGAKVQLWGCNGWSNQTWIWNGSTLRNADKGQCLDGDTNTIPANGAKVQLWSCNGWTNQSWTWH
ncbi:RICIN domain-containing protein [Kitasatospora sp. NBC_01250]|uniref:RICIN domain-containing protein n=1 Tax=unclassified Kitasatospora TaxID=2633591 RepID=UPI002E101B6D|nr:MULTISPECIES: RICIN domain-containing protein [unclassified Kitasatospora]WSJ70508.1 RICIN domain-containing protein [Kitasatospora sp. NBC_01302]